MPFGIENKINLTTKDQVNQISDYMLFLEAFVKEKNIADNSYKLFYLAPKGRTIAEESEGKHGQNRIEEGKLEIINYEDHIIPWLEECVKVTKNGRVSSFIVDFQKRLKEEYMGKEATNSTMITNLIAETDDNIEIAFTISNIIGPFKEEMRQKALKQMTDLADELSDKFQEDIVFEHDGKFFDLPLLKKTNVTFSYERNGIIYGLKKKDTYYKEYPYKLEVNGLKNKLGVRFKTSEWWPLFYLKYEGIEARPEFWQAINSGDFKRFMKDFILDIYRLDQILLEQL